MAPVIVISAANFASAILVESGLSFLGLGAQPPIPLKYYKGSLQLYHTG
jgi:peptide/nickel transport system permease protein